MFLKRQEPITFDPSNREHRAAVRAFMKRRAWVDSPIRFSHDPQYGSVAEQVQAKLLDWYIAQEEAKASKGKKVADSKALAFSLMGIASELPVEA